jgi:hypothetical protein
MANDHPLKLVPGPVGALAKCERGTGVIRVGGLIFRTTSELMLIWNLVSKNKVVVRSKVLIRQSYAPGGLRTEERNILGDVVSEYILKNYDSFLHQCAGRIAYEPLIQFLVA